MYCSGNVSLFGDHLSCHHRNLQLNACHIIVTNMSQVFVKNKKVLSHKTGQNAQ